MTNHLNVKMFISESRHTPYLRAHQKEYSETKMSISCTVSMHRVLNEACIDGHVHHIFRMMFCDTNVKSISNILHPK
jgi:hypothetical protein